MSTPTVSRRSRLAHTAGLLTPLNLHLAGLAVLALVNLYLLIQLGLAWRTASTQDDLAVARQTAAMHAAEQAAHPLRGLDGKLTDATASADQFYRRRLPFADSQIVAELGAQAKRQNIKLTRVQYAQSPVLEGAAGALTEVRMDASLTGDYRPLVVFINALERDRMFFLIAGVTLTGQQSGTVNLRLKLIGYLRPPGPDDVVPLRTAAAPGEDAP